MSGRRSTFLICLASALLSAALARGAVIVMTPEVLHDLTNGGTVTINNAVFVTVDSQRLDDLTIVTRNNTEYYQFLLDINQEAKAPLLTLNEVEVYLGNAPDLLSYSPNRSGGGTGFGPNSSFVYDLDQGTDNAIDLNYNLNSGSGSGDMWAYIPKANFDAAKAGNNNNFVYLYSKFGIPNANNDGYEEWSGIEGPNNNVPEPSSFLAAVLCVVLLTALRNRPPRRYCIASTR